MSGLDEANKIGNLFNSWGKIVFTFLLIVISCATAYYKIFENERDIAQEKKERIEALELSEERSDKRYVRAMEMAKELKDLGMKLEERVRELEKQNAYIKGQHNP